MRVLVTGAAGFVGTHLLGHLIGKGHDVHALALPGEKLASDLGEVPLHRSDVTDADSLENVLEETAPEWICHLAAIANPRTCRENPLLAWKVNFLGTHNLYRLAAEVVPEARVLFVGSAAEYGRPDPADLPLTEEAPLKPGDVYAATKVAGDLVGAQYARLGKLAVIRARPFNHIGPGQEPGYAAPDFARQIANIERGIQEPKLRVGNLSPLRDFLDVRDVVRAYALLLETGKPGAVYNVCSETARPVRELLDGLLALSTVRPEVVVPAGRARKNAADTLVGCAQAIRDDTGWQGEIPWEETLRDLLASWRKRVAHL